MLVTQLSFQFEDRHYALEVPVAYDRCWRVTGPLDEQLSNWTTVAAEPNSQPWKADLVLLASAAALLADTGTVRRRDELVKAIVTEIKRMAARQLGPGVMVTVAPSGEPAAEYPQAAAAPVGWAGLRRAARAVAAAVSVMVGAIVAVSI